MILHLSVLTGLAVPLAGWIAPIAIWQIKKDEFPDLDEHGKNVTNFLLSLLIYTIVSALLCIIVIGIPLLLAVAAIHIIFPIIAGLKASNGETWKYPLTITFIS